MDHASATTTTTTTLLERQSRPYTGPGVGEMISTHTLASNIIKYHDHDTSGAILDDGELELLCKFVNDPSSREKIMNEAGLEIKTSDVTGHYTGSLAGFVMVRHRGEVGENVEPVLTNEEIEMLKEWFASGKRESGQHLGREE